MRTRLGAVRLLAFGLAAALGWSVWATCTEVASLTPSEQMACCAKEQHTCGQHGTPAECCKTAPQASLSTAAVHKATARVPLIAVAHVLGTTTASFAGSWHPHPLSETWSPPGSKHPTYLVLSTLRL
jgi:hypothetical protein